MNVSSTPDDENASDSEEEMREQNQDGFFEPDDDDGSEFSLTQLSEAYAEVIEAQTGVKHTVGVPEKSQPEDDSSDPAEPSNADDDNAGCPISPESIVESILFVGAPRDVKLNSRKIAAVLRDVSPKEVTKIVGELNRRYEKDNAAYRIKAERGVFEMVLDPALIDFQQEFFGRNREVRLSQAAIEVMAVVAYNQPITLEQVEVLRNKPCGGVMRQLLKRQLIEETRDEKDPKTKYYCTADRFLDLFELEDLADLPQSHDMTGVVDLLD